MGLLLVVIIGIAVVYGVMTVTTQLRRTNMDDRRETAALAAALFDATFDTAAAQIRTVRAGLLP